jgi:type IV secretory pathway VirB2 component (pilin)
MTKQLLAKKTRFTCAFWGLIFSAVFFPAIASASSTTTALPWEGPLTTISNSLTGPVAQAVCLIVIVVTGLMLAFGEAGGTGKKMLRIVFGVAIALGAANFIASVFGSSSGILF